LIHEVAWSEGTIYSKSACNGAWNVRYLKLASANPLRYTPCATALPPICYRPVPPVRWIRYKF